MWPLGCSLPMPGLDGRLSVYHHNIHPRCRLFASMAAVSWRLWPSLSLRAPSHPRNLTPPPLFVSRWRLLCLGGPGHLPGKVGGGRQDGHSRDGKCCWGQLEPTPPKLLFPDFSVREINTSRLDQRSIAVPLHPNPPTPGRGGGIWGTPANSGHEEQMCHRAV